jgi:hypothetical protein
MPVTALAQMDPQYEAAIAAWARVLSQFVDTSGRTDFEALAINREDLDLVVDTVGRVSPESHPEAFATRQKKLAYHINAYNALAMSAVIEAGIPEDFNGFFRRTNFFVIRRIRVGGASLSLYNYENKVIRPLGDPRIHFALNCMVRDCPRLQQAPFRAETLESQLASATREFLSKDQHIRLDEDNRELWLSEIFDFYTDDFLVDGSQQGLIAYVNQYRDTPISHDFRVRFIPYDWTVNRQP